MSEGVARRDFARLPVGSAAAVQAVVLLAVNGGYGYHRDELYFRMLRPAWGYVDQPPLTPLLARLMRAIDDSVWVLRLPAVAAAAGSVVLIALLTREVGGGRAAQTLAAWGYAFSSFALVFGHVLLTNSLDTPVWLAVILCMVRAQLRAEPRWWYVGGVVVGLGLYNKLLVVVLLAAVAIGLLFTGGGRVLVSRAVLGAIGVAVLVGLPNVAYQVLNGLPQLSFGRALAAHKAADTRVQMWPLLVLMLGPPLTAVWIAGAVSLWRRPQWRAIRFLAAALPALLALVFLLGTQPTYPFAFTAALFAVGCVPTVDWWRRGRGRFVPAMVLVAVNSVVSSLIALPLVPVGRLGSTPIPGINQVTRDTVGWPVYVSEVARTYDALPVADRASAVLIASNYGEAGALDRYGPSLRLPRVYSPQNQLYFQARPPDTALVVVFVGGEVDRARALFTACGIVAHLDNHVGVDNEEQGEPIAVCRGPHGGWQTVWPELKHYD